VREQTVRMERNHKCSSNRRGGASACPRGSTEAADGRCVSAVLQAVLIQH
jgi:hypothetical protein